MDEESQQSMDTKLVVRSRILKNGPFMQNRKLQNCVRLQFHSPQSSAYLLHM